jgi:hypothetical protein
MSISCESWPLAFIILYVWKDCTVRRRNISLDWKQETQLDESSYRKTFLVKFVDLKEIYVLHEYNLFLETKI